MNVPAIVSALTIAGSDSGGGAGIQADLKAFAAHRIHGLSAIAALTAQHTHGVTCVHVPPVAFLRAQIDACFEDFNIGAVKLGMLANAAVIHEVADALEHHRPPIVILDPVMVATSGAKLLEDQALEAMRTRLFPLATLLTPNIPEASLLLGRTIADSNDADTAITELLSLGIRAVLLKGGHLFDDDHVVDRYADAATHMVLTHPRLACEAHGTGCTLASAITALACQGMSLPAACEAAVDYVVHALEKGYRPGRGDIVVLDHASATGFSPEQEYAVKVSH
ncbi:MAG: bifunctional hydroxymethylpyrimidine kinase/phosphomethylpyrimidine kinase [Xanthomonadaceae bacterium]|jgi:hydroxymethylpyrimidine/phosphomethylpyrimidine kinase|nr:bifunctional hydroxymethylpyrimidine kinase/phosphomethylpyrimidine kinase [Xanthomonadaceae bacterium]